MNKTIIFPFDNAECIEEKILRVENIIGKENINKDGLCFKIPEIYVRCSKEQWEEVKFRLDLCKTYM